jgi:hypothetical protein
MEIKSMSNDERSLRPMTSQEFGKALSTAVESLQHFYGEVDQMVAELKNVLAQSPGSLTALPGSTRKAYNPKHGRVVLRDEYSILFTSSPEDEDGGLDDDDDDNDEDEEPEGSKHKSAPVAIDTDVPLLALRISIWTPTAGSGFEPLLQYAVLNDWQVPGSERDDTLLVRRSMSRRIVRALSKKADPAGRVETGAKTIQKGKVKKKGKARLTCRIVGGVLSRPLYELDDPHAIDTLAESIKAHWNKWTAEAAEPA